MSKTIRREPVRRAARESLTHGNPTPASVIAADRREQGLEWVDLLYHVHHGGPCTWSDWIAPALRERLRHNAPELAPHRFRLCLDADHPAAGSVLVWWVGHFRHNERLYAIGGHCRARSARALTRELERRGYVEPLASRRPSDVFDMNELFPFAGLK